MGWWNLSPDIQEGFRLELPHKGLHANQRLRMTLESLTMESRGISISPKVAQENTNSRLKLPLYCLCLMQPKKHTLLNLLVELLTSLKIFN